MEQLRGERSLCLVEAFPISYKFARSILDNDDIHKACVSCVRLSRVIYYLMTYAVHMPLPPRFGCLRAQTFLLASRAASCHALVFFASLYTRAARVIGETNESPTKSSIEDIQLSAFSPWNSFSCSPNAFITRTSARVQHSAYVKLPLLPPRPCISIFRAATTSPRNHTISAE